MTSVNTLIASANANVILPARIRDALGIRTSNSRTDAPYATMVKPLSTPTIVPNEPNELPITTKAPNATPTPTRRIAQ
jgi:hypothetical protein